MRGLLLVIGRVASGIYGYAEAGWSFPCRGDTDQAYSSGNLSYTIGSGRGGRWIIHTPE